MLVHPIGSKVLMGPVDDAIEGVVTAISIRANDYVKYEVTWLNGRAHQCEWIEAAILRFPGADGPTKRIGFERAAERPSQADTGIREFCRQLLEEGARCST